MGSTVTTSSGGIYVINDLKIRNEKISDDRRDNHVDEELKLCFSKDVTKSFFVFAGAGSGKTRSLINILSYLNETFGEEFSIYSKKIAVITYTNAASDEISQRLQYKPIFAVSTIHSFLWELIKEFQTDIKDWVTESLKEEISELLEKESTGRGGNASIKRKNDIKKKNERLEKLQTITRFSYNPNGNNFGYDSLNHSEVIKMGAQFITEEKTMQKILIGKYPILLIDESQDTKKELIDAILTVQEKNKDQFTIGMFGDTMQRIYVDGKDNLSDLIPGDWSKPIKIMNHRSAKRIVELANSIRKTVDGQKQCPRSDAETGTVRLFIADASADKEKIEDTVTNIMTEKTKDNKWLKTSEYKSLILEHHMAASRFGFSNLYTPLNESKVFDTSLRDGSISELSFLFNVIHPLVKAYQENNHFEMSKVIRKHSPLLSKARLKEDINIQKVLIKNVEDSVTSLLKLWSCKRTPTCIEIFRNIKRSNLFKLNPRIDDILAPAIPDEHIKISALREALSVSFDQLVRYSEYVHGKTQFGTHQGVKGLEYPRVMVIMDDSEARGFLFSYEKLFGAKNKTQNDINNEIAGKDTSILRTARLFYVACTRAKESLAVVAYTEDKESVKETAMAKNWFLEEEIEIL